MIYCSSHEKQMYEEAGYWRSLPKIIPSVVFQTRVHGAEAFEWKEVSTWDLFSNKRVLLFSLPGAFTPTCSTYQLPSFEQLAEDFYVDCDIDEIYCFTVNDAFVCNAWAKANKLEEITVIPDGNGNFTEAMQMTVDKDNFGFGRRSWRYAAVVENGLITDWFIEEGKEDNCTEDPYLYTNPQYILERLRGGN